MGRSRRNKPAADAFNLGGDAPSRSDDHDSGGNSLQEVTSRGYGDSELIFNSDRNRVTVKQVSIFEISPDTEQPRRAVPVSVRRTWDGSAEGVADMLAAWITAFADERGVDFESAEETVLRALDGDETSRASSDAEHQPGIVEGALFRLVDLAASIKTEQLINPITVVRVGAGYRIETGERRWLAYHLLHGVYGDDYLKIPARVVDTFSVWEQAFENNARDDLNAISKARQLAVLLMDLHRGKDKSFAAYDAFDHDREFYAQVADGNAFRVPRGKGEILLQATGLNNRVQISNYRALLSLPDVVWEIADDLNWTENRLRPLVTMPTEEALQVACQMARDEGYTLSDDNVCDETEADNVVEIVDTGGKRDPLARVEKGFASLNTVTKRRVTNLSSEERERLAQLLATYEEKINAIRAWL